MGEFGLLLGIKLCLAHRACTCMCADRNLGCLFLRHRFVQKGGSRARSQKNAKVRSVYEGKMSFAFDYSIIALSPLLWKTTKLAENACGLLFV